MELKRQLIERALVWIRGCLDKIEERIKENPPKGQGSDDRLRDRYKRVIEEFEMLLILFTT